MKYLVNVSFFVAVLPVSLVSLWRMFFTALYVCLIGCFSVVTCSPGPTFSCVADNHVNGCNVLPFTPYKAVFTPACYKHDVCYTSVWVKSNQIACTCHVTQKQCCHAIFAVYTRLTPNLLHYYYSVFGILLPVFFSPSLMAFMFMWSHRPSLFFFLQAFVSF